MNRLASVLLGCVILLSCNQKNKDQLESTSSQRAPVEDKALTVTPTSSAEVSTDTVSNGSIPLQGSTPDWDKKIIKNATLKLEISDIKKFNSVVYASVKQHGGYIAKEEQQNSDHTLAANIEIKVPVATFESLVNSLTTGDVKVNQRTINSEDVTSTYVDTKARLQAKEQLRLRYFDLLKNAKNMSEILQVQSEINRLQEDIEAGTTHVNQLSRQSAMSTINLYFEQPNATVVNTDKPSFVDRVLSALKKGGIFIAELFIGLLTIWPLLLTGLLAIVIYKKRVNVKKVTTS
jgi:hypothetical protein